PVVLSRGAIHAAGPYRCPDVTIRARAVATNTPPNGAFRGFGAPQTQFAMECQMDAIAARLGLDTVALRRHNAVGVGDVTPTGQTLRESVSAVEVLDRTATRVGWAKRRAELDRANAAAAGGSAARAVRAGANGGGGSANGNVARRTRRGLGMALVYHGAG